jgi:hypothetical protein
MTLRVKENNVFREVGRAYSAAELWRRAGAVPSLDLRFADNKSWVDVISGQNLVTFTRASSGTFVGSNRVLQTAAANEPRFDHDPVTGESLGLLVEETRTNFIIRSEELSDTAWGKARCSITADVIAAPNGSLTADLLVEDGSNNTHRFLATPATVAANPNVTFSVYFKAKERTQIQLYIDESTGAGGAAFFAFFSASGVTGSGSAGVATYTSSSVQSLRDGWYRAIITGSLAGGYTSYRCSIFTAVAGATSYQGDGTSGIYLWGAQLEAGAFPTSYIPTTTAAVTRSADVASITGSAFSSWYRQDEGTVFAEGSGLTTTQRWGSFNSVAAFSECINFGSVTGGLAELTVRTPTTTTAVNITAGNTLQAGAIAKDAFRYAVNDFAVTRNGVTPSTSTSGNLPNTRNTLYIGVSANTFSYHNGHIRRLTFWAQRLSNSTMQSITQ